MLCYVDVLCAVFLASTLLDSAQAITIKAIEHIKNGSLTRTEPKGLQCYNCLSYDSPGCWDPKHPDYENTTIPNTDCYLPGVSFYCIVITVESAELVDSEIDIGPVRVRTCVPSHKFNYQQVSYSKCNKLSQELAASEVFSKIKVIRPHCDLCHSNFCTEPEKWHTKKPMHLTEDY